MLKKQTIKQFVLTIGLLLLAACTATTAVPEPSAQMLPTKSPELRAQVTESQNALETVVEETAFEEVVEVEQGATIDKDDTVALAAERTGKLALELGDAAILYQKSGGFAGVNERWWIYEDGRLVDAEGNESQIPTELVSAFLADSKRLGLSRMRQTYVPVDHCCDQFLYSLIVRQGDEIIQVTTADGVDAPAALNDLLAKTAELVASDVK